MARNEQDDRGWWYFDLVERTQKTGLLIACRTDLITCRTDIEHRLDAAAALSEEALVRLVWLMPLSMGQRYRMADAMMRGDLPTIRLIADEAITDPVAALPAEVRVHCQGAIPHPTDRDLDPDALHGRAPGPRIGERGGPGEPPPGDDPG